MSRDYVGLPDWSKSDIFLGSGSAKAEANLAHDDDELWEHEPEPSRGIAALKLQGRSEVEAGDEDGVGGRAANLRPQRDLLSNVALQRVEIDWKQRHDEVHLRSQNGVFE